MYIYKQIQLPLFDKNNIISSNLPSDRPNNHSRSRELRTFLYDVADL